MQSATVLLYNRISSLRVTAVECQWSVLVHPVSQLDWQCCLSWSIGLVFGWNGFWKLDSMWVMCMFRYKTCCFKCLLQVKVYWWNSLWRVTAFIKHPFNNVLSERCAFFVANVMLWEWSFKSYFAALFQEKLTFCAENLCCYRINLASRVTELTCVCVCVCACMCVVCVVYLQCWLLMSSLAVR